MALTTTEMEVRLARYFDYRRMLIVPNIGWGMNVHECDLFIVTGSNYVYEVEIKISKSDLVNDTKKRHQHKNNKIKRLYFAIPACLEKHIEYIPKQAGIIIIAENQTYKGGFKRGVKVLREPISNKEARALTPKEVFNTTRLGAMRIWPLKEKIINLKKKVLACNELKQMQQGN